MSDDNAGTAQPPQNPPTPPAPPVEPPKPPENPAPPDPGSGTGDRVSALETGLQSLTVVVQSLVDLVAGKNKDSAPVKVPWTHKGGRHDDHE